MTKSYVIGWFTALFALGVVSLTASASEVTGLAQSQVELITVADELPGQTQQQAGLPLYPLVEPKPEEPQATDDDAESPLDTANTSDDPPPALSNLVELPEQDMVPREFVLFIVRHMEKEDSTLDPGLTAEGVIRADALAQLLSTADIERIYSTMYRRSAGTALPLARALALPVEFYQADDSDAFVSKVLDAGQSALIVGHSNTVAELVNNFGGSAEALSEESYGDIFQLVIRADGEDHEVRQVHLKAPLIVTQRRGTR